MPRLTLLLSAFVLFSATAFTQVGPQPDSFTKGLKLDAEIAQWHNDADARHYRHVLEAVNERVDKDGGLTLKPGENAADFARAILLVCRVSRYKQQYYTAAKTIYDDLMAGSKPLTPQQAFAAVPFRVQYDVTFAQMGDIPAALDAFKDIQPFLNKTKARDTQGDNALWLGAALVDTLEVLPSEDPHRPDLRRDVPLLLSRMNLEALHIWTGHGSEVANDRNLAEYAVHKAVRLDYLPDQSALFPGTYDTRFTEDGHDPYVMLAVSELAQAATAERYRHTNVTVDGWFNSQVRATPAGNDELYHYKWNDEADSGYSFFGRAFQRYGAHLTTLAQEPTAVNLAGSQIYMIVSPDIPSKNANPHYMQPQDVEAITQWVAKGGVLMLFHNDNTNTEFEHFNTLAGRFGIHYNPVLKNPVQGTRYGQGQILIPANSTGVFQDAHSAYMKEIDTISTQPPAQPVLRDTLHGSGDVYMAVSHFGKGVVFATVDPWLYNEYTDGQKLGGYSFDPYPAAVDLARWALSVSKRPR